MNEAANKETAANPERKPIGPDPAVPLGALDNKPIEVELCGLKFQFSDPVKRRSRYLLGRSMHIITTFNLFVEEEDDEEIHPEESAAARNAAACGGMMAVPDVLDFLYDALKVDKIKRKKIEKKFVEKEIFDAFGAIFRKLNAPFVGTRPGTDPAKEEEASPTG